MFNTGDMVRVACTRILYMDDKFKQALSHGYTIEPNDIVLVIATLKSRIVALGKFETMLIFHKDTIGWTYHKSSMTRLTYELVSR